MPVDYDSDPARCAANQAATARFYKTNTVSVVDTVTNTVTATILVGDAPHAVTVGPDGRHAYTANFGSGARKTASASARSCGGRPCSSRTRTAKPAMSSNARVHR